MLPNLKAVGLIEAELHILKFKKLDTCIRPLFANSVTYMLYAHAYTCVGLSLYNYAFKFSNYSFWKFFLNSPIILKIILKIIPTFSQLFPQKVALFSKTHTELDSFTI